ncbi:MAG: LysM peptidoglycan-binding domain-containing protein [Polyangiaceae bacterium]|nr:LysM peptidoglycan-binding domain-containing protein [Polyangiaceae bacterium]
MSARAWRALAAAVCCSGVAGGFPHVVKKGETLASIADAVYGRPAHERLLVSANALEHAPIAVGMRLEIPANQRHRVSAGETWASLAAELLGDPERADVLSIANDSSPWLAPPEGAEIIVPYNLRVEVGQGDTLVSIAQKYLGKREHAWVLDRYNGLKGRQPKKGELVLVPLSDLRLTDEGKARALAATLLARTESTGSAREAQRRVDQELPGLLADINGGRYVDAVTRGTRMLSYGELGRAQVAAISRQLLEAYVALGARGHASQACRALVEASPDLSFDPVYVSPKIISACGDATLTAPPPASR